MPRSFRFEHFTVQKPKVSRSLQNKEKQRVAAGAPLPGEAQLHYGKRYSETEELAKARVESSPREQAARRDRVEPASAGDASIPTAATPTPIGSTQPLEEPPPVRGMLDVIDEGRQQVGAIARSLEEAVRAALRILRLSMELGRLAANRLRPRA
jgi:hypothetical protein